MRGPEKLELDVVRSRRRVVRRNVGDDGLAFFARERENGSGSGFWCVARDTALTGLVATVVSATASCRGAPASSALHRHKFNIVPIWGDGLEQLNSGCSAQAHARAVH